MIDISVIICTYNRATMLNDALASFHEIAKPPGLKFELIIVDNCSIDNTKDLVTQWNDDPEMQIRYFLEPQQGSSYARNHAISVAQGDWIWFVDDDIYFDKGWLSGVCNAIKQFPQASAIAGRILLEYECEAPVWLNDRALDYYGLTGFGEKSRLLKTDEYPVAANAGFRRNVFQQVGYFRTDLGRKYNALISWDETELSMRIIQSGGQIAYTHEAIIYHRVTADRLKRSWLYRRVFADGISECRAQHDTENSSAMFCIKSALNNILLILRNIFNTDFSINDQIWMMRHVGIAYQYLVNAFQFKR